MLKDNSCVSQYFNRQYRKGDWLACRLPSFLIDTFESKTANSLQLDNANGINVPPYACSFSSVPNEYNIAAVVDEDGQLSLMNILRSKSARLSVIARWNCHANAVFDTRWLPSEKYILTASGDQTLALHDLISQKRITSFLGHSSSVRAVDLQPYNSNVFTSASRDGSMRLWDRRHSKMMKRRGQSGLVCVHCVTACHQPVAVANNRYSRMRGRRKPLCTDIAGTDKSVTSVAFVDEHRITSCGSTDGMIKIWDIRKLVSNGKPIPSMVIPYQGESKKNYIGYSHILVDHMNSRLFAVCRDHVIYQYGLAMASPTPQMMYRGHCSASFYIRASLSPDSRYIVCGSTDCNAYIYQVDQKNQYPVMLRGFEGEVTDVKWSPYDPSVIVALSDDCWVRVWRMNRQNALSNNNADDMWGLAERKVVRLREDTTTKLQNISTKKSLLSGPVHCPNSPSVRQLNIENFLTPSIGSVGKGGRIPMKANSPDAFSLMDAEQVTNILPASPKKLMISPRKQSSARADGGTTLKRRLSSYGENSSPSTPRRSPARKRLRFNSSSCDNVTLFREVQNVPRQESVGSPRQISSSEVKGAKKSDNKAQQKDAFTPGKPQRKEVKEGTSNRSRKSTSRKRSSAVGTLPITNFFPRSSL